MLPVIFLNPLDGGITNGHTALSRASAKGHEDIVTLLKQYGAADIFSLSCAWRLFFIY